MMLRQITQNCRLPAIRPGGTMPSFKTKDKSSMTPQKTGAFCMVCAALRLDRDPEEFTAPVALWLSAGLVGLAGFAALFLI
jgi:hypothetical protein